ncbi:MAG: ribosomal protein [Burkholderiales bacterium]|jgi:small subunit ribosomal protein S17|nr:ribosomal protein [Burkholderiales bacterium]
MAKVVRSLVGKVVSDAVNKSVTVLIERRVKHPLLGKIVKKFKKYRAHDENNQYKAGNQVVIVECKPISKTKAWTVESLASKI